MSTILRRVGGGYSKKCSQCEFSARQAQEAARQAQEASGEVLRHKEELSTLRNELDKITEKNVELERKITMMIDEKATEELNVMSKLEQITNLLGLVTTHN
jgi:uncharacterized protein YlxW (UPF0749 family)